MSFYIVFIHCLLYTLSLYIFLIHCPYTLYLYTVTHTLLYIVFKHCLFILSLYIVLIHCPYTLSHTLSCTLSYTLSQAVLYSSEQNTVATLYIISNSVFSCKNQLLCTAVEIHWQVLLLQKGIRGFFSVRNSYAFKNMWKLSLRKLGAVL